MGRMYDLLADGGRETGADPYTQAIASGAEFLGSLDLGGVAAKQERTAEAARDAARAELEAARVGGATAVELARLAIELRRLELAAAQEASAFVPASGGGKLATVPGVGQVPVWALVAAAVALVAVVVWPR